MNDPWAHLEEPFAGHLRDLIADCKSQGIEMRLGEGARHPVIQGKLYAQSRSAKAITARITELKQSGCLYLADCLAHGVKLTDGHVHPWATNAYPGLGWHQYGTAADGEWVGPDGKVNWTVTTASTNGYQVWMANAHKHGLTAIGLTMHTDAGHVQLDPHGSPNAIYTLKAIDAMMQHKWANVPVVAS